MAKDAFNKKRDLFTSKMNLELRKKLVKCYKYIWGIVLYGAESWTLQAVDQKHLENFGGAGEGWRRSFGPIM
jgi:hypothetical protein